MPLWSSHFSAPSRSACSWARPGWTKPQSARQRLAGREGPLRLLVLGGSQGARALNDSVPVALAANDRALTRRIGAHLASSGVAVRDENGWTLSTTRAASQLMAALKACAWNASADEVLDWLKHTPLIESSILNALEQMRQASTHVAFVVNEFGGFEGLLTLTDILEAIAGELPDASEVDGPDIEPDGAGFRVSGALNLALLRSRIGLQAQATEDYQTLAGLVMSLLDRLPVVGDEVEFAGWRMRVEEVHERRVNRLLLVQVQA